MRSANGRAVKKAMAAGPEYREDPATVTPEEQGRPHQTAYPSARASRA